MDVIPQSSGVLHTRDGAAALGNRKAERFTSNMLEVNLFCFEVVFVTPCSLCYPHKKRASRLGESAQTGTGFNERAKACGDRGTNATQPFTKGAPQALPQGVTRGTPQPERRDEFCEGAARIKQSRV